MSRTPLNSRALTDGKDRTPLGSRVIRDKTPLGNRVLNSKIQSASVDQQLLDVLRSLNLAVAAVAQARDKRYIDPDAKLTPQVAVQALLHLKDAAQQLDQLRRNLAP
ncbi:MAG TPA: hypothetical protein VHX44_12890, partial [Planctomycetota bacterium]|nr:hypothetical protein [Planctomycetota bacterium]